MKIVHILIILLGSSFLLSVPIDRYHTYDEIQAKLEAWDQEYGIESGSSDIIFELSEIGRSALLDLPFWMVKISDNANEDEDEPRILILGQCHAEEILGVELSMQLIECLLDPSSETCYSNSMKSYISSFRANTEIYIVPTHNPEGLSVVHGTQYNDGYIQDSSYRKNMTDANGNGVFDYDASVQAGGDFDGVDLNRNYDFNWGFGDAYGVPDYGSCNSSYTSDYDYYKGSSPASESETEAITKLAIEKQFLLSVAYHSSRSGCVSEKVIYPWLWEDNKPSPDFEVIERLGQEIAALIPKEIENNSYEARNSVSRKGNAHDWFYKTTGTFQYLIELGTSNLQPDDPELIDDTIERNFRGLFYLISRAYGRSQGNYGVDENYMVEGIVKSDGEIVPGAMVSIEELSGGVLNSRTTDKFGRYRRLLNSGSYTLITSAFGYEPDTTVFTASSNGNDIDIELEKLESFPISISTSRYPAAIQINDLEWDTSFVITEPIDIILPQGQYHLTVTTDTGFPFISDFFHNSSRVEDIDIYSRDAVFEEDFSDDTLISYATQNCDFQWMTTNGKLYSPVNPSTGLYPNNCISKIILLPTFSYNGSEEYVLEMTLSNKLEWDHDSFSVRLVDSIVGGNEVFEFIEASGHGEINKGVYTIPVMSADAINDSFEFFIELGIESDSSVAYEGVEIESITIYKKESDVLSSADYMYPSTSAINNIIAYPNPFNAVTNLSFKLTTSTDIDINIYDLNGNYIKNIINNQFMIPNSYNIAIDMEGYSTGLYFIELSTNQSTLTKQILYLK